MYSQFRGDGGVSGHGFGGQVVVAVRAVQEGLSPLAVTGEVSVEDQARAGRRLGVQGAAAGGGAILHIKTANRETRNVQDDTRDIEGRVTGQTEERL